jgi:hypothetical protein
MEKSEQTDTFRAGGKVTERVEPYLEQTGRLQFIIEQRIVAPPPKKAEYLLYFLLSKDRPFIKLFYFKYL